MVYINSKKYACESCIKGHRSSSCAHNSRPLFEIKKKGRPVSQCERCREARQSRKIHAKCNCEYGKGGDIPLELVAGTSKRGKRFIPTVPSLPNGLKDALKPQPVAGDGSIARRQVETLLNPCHCKDVYNCTCRSQSSASSKSSISPSIFNDGLSALAHVAACCAPASSSTLPAAAPIAKTPGGLPAYDRNGTRISFDPPSQSTSTSQLPAISESINSTTNQNSGVFSNIYNPSFPIKLPHLNTESSGPISSTRPAANTSSCCSSSATSSTSNGACGCGQHCACAGCVYHEAEARSPDSFHIRSPSDQVAPTVRPTHRASCGADCPTCVDYDGGVELPGTRQMPTFIDQFLQRAAALPPPPPVNHTRGTSLDPTNIIVYPRGLFTGLGRDERGRAFGLVNVPKLECCGGRCSCPDDKCGCGDSCGGCCVDDAEPGSNVDQRQVSPSVSFARRSISHAVRSSGKSS